MQDKLYEHGGAFGYNVIKCHLITKPDVVQKANKVFSGLDVDVSGGSRFLRSVIGSDKKLQHFSERKVNGKGASCWLNALPVKGIILIKSRETLDGIAFRYGWDPLKLPSTCACWEIFNLAHALHCRKHVAIRTYDTMTSVTLLLDEVCDDVKVEPCLQTLQAETFANRTTITDDDARLYINANGFFDSRFSGTFFDVNVFNPYAKICPRSKPGSYKYHESIKKLKYEQRIIEVEKATFCPLIFSCTGGDGP